jgi:hypothetical protein
MSPPPPHPRWLPPTLLACLLLLASWTLLGQPGESLLAWRGAEVWGHAWTWWWHGEALPSWPAGTELASGTEHWPVIDPLPAIIAATLSRLLGIITAWNLMALAAIAGAFAGGWWLARRVGGSGPVGGLVLAMGPVFTGSLLSGLSEDLAIGLLAVSAGLVLRPTPQGPGSWRWAAATGACLGLLAWCGPYLAWLGALTACSAGLAHLIHRPRGWARWLGAALGAALLALPPLLAQGERALQGVGHRKGVHLAEGVEPLWQLNPWGQADLASFLAPGAAELPADAVIRLHPVYLGLAVIFLALWAGRSRWWWLLAAALLVAPGERLHWLGQATKLPNPAALALDWIPGGALLNHHARLFMLGQVALAALAALGAVRLHERVHAWRGRSSWLLPTVCLFIVADLGLFAPVPWPLPTARADAPDFLAELDELGPGSLLWLPAGGPGLSPQRPLLDQRVHRRPLALDPNHPGAPYWLPREPLGGWLAGLGRGEPPPPPPSRDLRPLLEHGVRVLAVAAPHHHKVTELLGPSQVQGEDGAAWDLAVVAARIPDMLFEEPTP